MTTFGACFPTRRFGEHPRGPQNEDEPLGSPRRGSSAWLRARRRGAGAWTGRRRSACSRLPWPGRRRGQPLGSEVPLQRTRRRSRHACPSGSRGASKELVVPRARDYPRPIVTVELVFTERRSDMTESRARNLERLRERVAAARERPSTSRTTRTSTRAGSRARAPSSSADRRPPGLCAIPPSSRCSAKRARGGTTDVRHLRRDAAPGAVSREGRSTSERALSTDSSRSGSTIAATCCATCPKTPSCSRITPMRSRSCPRGFASRVERARARCRRSQPPGDAGGGRSSIPRSRTPSIQRASEWRRSRASRSSRLTVSPRMQRQRIWHRALGATGTETSAVGRIRHHQQERGAPRPSGR